MPAGGAAVELADTFAQPGTLFGQPCWLVNMPTARVNCGIEPMKKADWDRLVVPVLAMISRPSGRPAVAAVPPGLVSKDSA